MNYVKSGLHTGLMRDGVEVRPSSLRSCFRFNGKYIKETFYHPDGTPMEPTPANMKWATRTVAAIKVKISLGTFEIADYFPDSVHAEVAVPNTFGELADQWLKSKGTLTETTLYQYGQTVLFWKKLLGTNMPMTRMTYKVLATKIGAHAWPSAKSSNNALVSLRGIFAFEYFGKRANENPMIGIKNSKPIKKRPDPFTADERDLILADMAEHYDPRVTAYFTFAFFTGMRPEEIIALRWSDIDFHEETTRVRRVRTFKGSERDGSKTHAERDVDLVGKAMKAIRMMEPYTSANLDGDIFERPAFMPARVSNIKTGKSYNAGQAAPAGPWHDTRSQNDTYWKPTMARLGIRHRPPYTCRHTYATTALAAGVAPGYISTQMGHVNTKMLHEVYSKWIKGADKGVQRAALNAAMGGVSAPKNWGEKSRIRLA